MNQRLDQMRAYLNQNGDKFEGFFVSKPENRSYLSGFTGSFGYLLITPQDAILFTDGRYVEQATSQAPGWTVVRLQRPFEQAVAGELKRLNLRRLAFEAEHLTFGDYTYWSGSLENSEWFPTQGVISGFRQRKGPEEVAQLRQAVAIADKAFEYLLGILKPGMTEREAAAELEFAMRKYGADAIAFDTILASGWRGALPHGRASDKKIEKGELITVDFGARFESYNSDITRTVVIGQPTERQRQIYDLVLGAQLAGCEAVRPGVSCSEVDGVSRKYFENAGVVEYFLHSLGHSLGREVHETPFLTPTDTTPLEPGMVVTVEPGLYISEWGGVRIEDDLLVTASGAEILPRSPKELIIL
jgi:Xaa-Pro aminopeptidase